MRTRQRHSGTEPALFPLSLLLACLPHCRSSSCALSLLHAQTLQWASQQSGVSGSSRRVSPPSPDTAGVLDLVGSSGPATLKRWIADALQSQPQSQPDAQSTSCLHLRPIAAFIRGDSKHDGESNGQSSAEQSARSRFVESRLAYLLSLLASFLPPDGPSVISVARSFGLSTTTGARGDAVSYVLEGTAAAASAQPAAAAASPSVVRGVVKVVKSASTFQQECAALTIIQLLLPNPQHVRYPHALGACWARIPTAIPQSSLVDGSASFARPYSVSSLTTSMAGSTSSSDAESCVGGVLLMECAPGAPLAEFFKAIGRTPAGSAQRQALLDDVLAAIKHAARALAELHNVSHCPSLPASASQPFLAETERAMREMLSKLALDQYRSTLQQWNIDLPAMNRALDKMKEEVWKEPGGERQTKQSESGRITSRCFAHISFSFRLFVFSSVLYDSWRCTRRQHVVGECTAALDADRSADDAAGDGCTAAGADFK